MTKYINLRWAEKQIQHIARHGIIPEEVEEVLYSDKYSFIQKTGEVPKISGGNLYAVFGSNREGRLLTIMLLNTSSGYYVPITARDMDNTERKYYQKRG